MIIPATRHCRYAILLKGAILTGADFVRTFQSRKENNDHTSDKTLQVYAILLKEAILTGADFSTFQSGIIPGKQ